MIQNFDSTDQLTYIQLGYVGPSWAQNDTNTQYDLMKQTTNSRVEASKSVARSLQLTCLRVLYSLSRLRSAGSESRRLNLVPTKERLDDELCCSPSIGFHDILFVTSEVSPRLHIFSLRGIGDSAYRKKDDWLSSKVAGWRSVRIYRTLLYSLPRLGQ